MHEIRATLPPEQVAAATRLARAVGVQRVSIADVYVHGPNYASCPQSNSKYCSCPA